MKNEPLDLSDCPDFCLASILIPVIFLIQLPVAFLQPHWLLDVLKIVTSSFCCISPFQVVLSKSEEMGFFGSLFEFVS